MRKSKINSIEDGYNELFSDVFKDSFNLENNSLQFNYEEGVYLVIFYTCEDKQQFFKFLTMFSVEPDMKELIRVRYGLDTGEAKTLKELSNSLGITDEAIRSKLVSAKRKMKHKLNVRRTLELYNRERSDSIGAVMYCEQ